ncbi:lysylphosphatidylglycerol synthase domain-containing protein, partial [Thioclava sp. UBA3469]
MALADPAQPAPPQSRVKILWPIALGLVLFLMGLWALHHLLASIDVHQVIAQIKATPWPTLGAALGATSLGYLALVGYDFWALHYLGKQLPPRTVALGGFLGYAFGNTVGISVISGGAVRYRIYSAAGLNAFEVAALSSYIALAMGLGLTMVGALALCVHPAALAGVISAPEPVIRIGALAATALILGGAFYLSYTGRALRIRDREIAMPVPRILIGQLGVALFDSTMAAGALWVLMPAGTPPFASFVAIYAAASMVGILSHVPGGVGVFETVVIAALPAGVPLGEAAAGLLAFRMIYFLLPFVIAFVVVSLNEARLAGGWATRVFGEISEPMRPVISGIEGLAPRIAGVAVLGLGFWMVIVALMPVLGRQGGEPGLITAMLAEGGTQL